MRRCNIQGAFFGSGHIGAMTTVAKSGTGIGLGRQRNQKLGLGRML